STADLVIGGFTHGDRDYFSSLVLGCYGNDGKLVHAGQVGTGFNDKSLQEIFSRVEPLITKKSPFPHGIKALRDVTWVQPELVAEVKYLEVTPDGLLRAPDFLRLRPDKDPKQCTRSALIPDEADQPTEASDASVIQREPLVTAKSPGDVTLDVGGQRLKLTNLNKVYYPG